MVHNLSIFPHNDFSITLDRHRYLLKLIKLVISLRSTTTNRIKADYFNIIQLPGLYQPGFDFINLNKVFRRAAAHLPAGAATKPIITSKYEKGISSKFINTGAIAKMTPEAINQVLNSPCCCELPGWSRYKNTTLGHVCTNDYRCLPRSLQDLAQMGAKYRTGLQSGVVTSSMRDEIKSLSLTAFAKFAAKYENDLEIIGWDTWSATIISALDEQLDADLPLGKHLTAPSFADGSAPELLFSPSSLQSLRHFHRNFAITLVDKMANSFAFVCKKQYLLWMMADLNSSDVFQQCTTPPAEVISAITAKMATLHLIPSFPIFPNYSLTVKFHKIDPTGRFLVGAHACINTPAAKELCHVARTLDTFLPALLLTLFSTLPDDFRSSFDWHEISPVLKNAANMVEVITAFNQQFKDKPVSFQSGDVSRLYTNIPLNELRSRLRNLYALIFSTRGSALKVFNHDKNSPVWLSAIPPPECRTGGKNLYDRYKIYTLDDIFNLIDFVLDNNYFQFGGQLLLQIQGIAMGGNASVFIANHFLFSYEYQFLQQLVTAIRTDPCTQAITSLPIPAPPTSPFSKGDVARFLLPIFIWLFRYIDDIASIDNAYLEQLLYTDRSFYGFEGIYPPVLDITLTPPSSRLKYLDIEIGSRDQNGTTPLQTTFYNKFSEPEFSHLPVIRYTHITSNLSRRCKDNILGGRFAALSQNLTSRASFIKAMASVFVGLVERGYPFGKLKRNLRTLCGNHSGLYGFSSQALHHNIVFQAKRCLRQSMENS